MCWSALLLALCGQALCARALAAVEAPAPAPLEGLPTSADVLLPETDRDVVALLAHLMSAQHELVLAMHGPDSPLAALSFAATTAQEQFTNWFLQLQNNPPAPFDMAYNFVQNFTAAANATLFKISPNLARNVAFGKLEWFQNAPKVATNAQVFAAIAPFGLLVQPCLFRFGPSGVFVDPQAIAISPRVLHVEATGVNISPAGISIGPILIAVTPSGTNIGLTHVAVSPVFLDVAPTVRVVAGSGKPATFAKGIAVNAQPKPAVVTDARGKVVRPSPAVATTATSSSGSVASATGIAPPATGGG